jgi:preprotein translocase subunit YajC
MNTLAFITLQAATAGPQGGQSATNMLLMMGLVFVIFYFFMIRPQMKRQKEVNNFRNTIAKGDKVVTTGGIYGKIVEVTDTYVILEIANDVKVKVDKSAVMKDPSDVAQK